MLALRVTLILRLCLYKRGLLLERFEMGTKFEDGGEIGLDSKPNNYKEVGVPQKSRFGLRAHCFLLTRKGWVRVFGSGPSLWIAGDGFLLFSGGVGSSALLRIHSSIEMGLFPILPFYLICFFFGTITPRVGNSALF